MANLSAEAKELFKEFVKNTRQDLIARVRANEDRFPTGDKLVNRYEEVALKVLDQGTTRLREFHEAHNELCSAAAILENESEPNVTRLEYEPRISRCDQRFDFQAEMSAGPTRYVEVKTIHPISQEDWNKYQTALKKGRFPQHTHLILNEEWLGGELYHNAYAARSKMLEYALIVEDKIEACLSDAAQRVTFLALFTNGFHWHLDELEDFVFFYLKGVHFPGDPFAKMEEFAISEKKIQFKRSIDHFAYFRRPKTEIRPNKVVWSVSVPNMPY